MKRLFQVLLLTGMLVASACNVHLPASSQRTSSARAAYGNAVPGFKAHKRMNKKRKEKARKEAKRKKVRNNRSYWYGRPY